MKALKAEAKKVMNQEKSYDSEKEALAEAVKNRGEFVSVWKSPDGKYVVVQQENREEAFLCEYEEVYDTGKLFDMAKSKIDHITEV